MYGSSDNWSNSASVSAFRTGGIGTAHNAALSVNDDAEDAAKGIPAGQECVRKDRRHLRKGFLNADWCWTRRCA